MTMFSHLYEQEQVSSVASELLALALVAGLAFWLVLLPY